MAVFPDRIVQKNSSDSDALIRAAIAEGAPDSITIGELVISTNPANPAIYIKDALGDVRTVAGSGGGGTGGGGSSVIISKTPPTTRVNGDPIDTGDIWFNPLNRFLYIRSTDQDNFRFSNATYSFTKQRDYGYFTGDLSDLSFGFSAGTLFVNAWDENSKDFLTLVPDSASDPAVAFWGSIDDGVTWVQGTIGSGPFVANANGSKFIVVGGSLSNIDIENAVVLRLTENDPTITKWVQTTSDQLVKSVNLESGIVSLGIKDMDDYLVKRSKIEDLTPGFGVVPTADDTFSLSWSEYLDAQSDTYPTANPVAGEWTMYRLANSNQVMFRAGNTPSFNSSLQSYDDLPPIQPGRQYYVDFTIFGDFPDPAETSGSKNSFAAVRTIPLDTVSRDSTGVYALFDVKYLDPLDLYWGFAINNPDRVATQPPVAVYCSATIGTELRAADEADGDVLLYDANTDEWVHSEFPLKNIDDLADVQRKPGSLGIVYKYQGVGSADFFDVGSPSESSKGLASTEWFQGRVYLVMNTYDLGGQELRNNSIFSAYEAGGNKESIWISTNQGASWRIYGWECQDNFFNNPNANAFVMTRDYLIVDETVEVWVTLQAPDGGARYKEGEVLSWSEAVNAFVPTTIDVVPPPQSLDDLTDVDVSTVLPTNNQALAYNANTGLWRPYTVSAVGGGNALVAQSAYEQQTTDVSGKATFGLLGFWGNLTKIECDQAAWVTLYATDAARTADLTRPFGTMPTPGAGVLAGFNLGANAPFVATPPMPYFNGEPTSLNEIYALARLQDGTVIQSAIISINAYGARFFDTISGGTFSGA